MTYCLGILVYGGLVLASDSRSNAGVDQVQTVRKLSVLAASPAGVIALAVAGNLATTQSVVTQLAQAMGSGRAGEDLRLAETMFDVASIVGRVLRTVVRTEAKYVKPYRKGQKNDFRDAEAIAEAVQRPTMKFVATKTADQLDLQALHRVRERLVSQRTGISNQIRAFLLERGIAVRQGLRFLRAQLPEVLAKRTDVLSDRMEC